MEIYTQCRILWKYSPLVFWILWLHQRKLIEYCTTVNGQCSTFPNTSRMMNPYYWRCIRTGLRWKPSSIPILSWHSTVPVGTNKVTRCMTSGLGSGVPLWSFDSSSGLCNAVIGWVCFCKLFNISSQLKLPYTSLKKHAVRLLSFINATRVSHQL